MGGSRSVSCSAFVIVIPTKCQSKAATWSLRQRRSSSRATPTRTIGITKRSAICKHCSDVSTSGSFGMCSGLLMLPMLLRSTPSTIEGFSSPRFHRAERGARREAAHATPQRGCYAELAMPRTPKVAPLRCQVGRRPTMAKHGDRPCLAPPKLPRYGRRSAEGRPSTPNLEEKSGLGVRVREGTPGLRIASSINTLLRFKVCETHLSELDINGHFHLIHVVIRRGFREAERQAVMIDPCSRGLVGGFSPSP
ncbi:ORFV2 [Zebra finch circovirus]|uniref:ORFV2 n=1 Tax=Zebra finch circovirus TaxID=1642515 RepID=A0A0E3Z6D0_9CIRC|nr:ORFV2 [Zebra finch circovirus]AKC88561.1 ORFV2 [Zebra finch circovirus]